MNEFIPPFRVASFPHALKIQPDDRGLKEIHHFSVPFWIACLSKANQSTTSHQLEFLAPASFSSHDLKRVFWEIPVKKVKKCRKKLADLVKMMFLATQKFRPIPCEPEKKTFKECIYENEWKSKRPTRSWTWWWKIGFPSNGGDFIIPSHKLTFA